MRSDLTVYLTYKYLPMVLGAFLILVPLFGYLHPENSTFNGAPGPPDIWATVIFLLLGLILVLIPFTYKERIIIVELNNLSIKIEKEGQLVDRSWLDVEYVRMLPVLFPPLYKLKFKNDDDYYLFNTSRWGAQFLFFSWDWSGMGSLIKRKKKELDL
uniref:hypothetical protein n=1 Tax=Fulvivirga sp. TaxID=1931237 RepID=UPI00404B7C66